MLAGSGGGAPRGCLKKQQKGSLPLQRSAAAAIFPLDEGERWRARERGAISADSGESWRVGKGPTKSQSKSSQIPVKLQFHKKRLPPGKDSTGTASPRRRRRVCRPGVISSSNCSDGRPCGGEVCCGCVLATAAQRVQRAVAKLGSFGAERKKSAGFFNHRFSPLPPSRRPSRCPGYKPRVSLKHDTALHYLRICTLWHKGSGTRPSERKRTTCPKKGAKFFRHLL